MLHIVPVIKTWASHFSYALFSSNFIRNSKLFLTCLDIYYKFPNLPPWVVEVWSLLLTFLKNVWSLEQNCFIFIVWKPNVDFPQTIFRCFCPLTMRYDTSALGQTVDLALSSHFSSIFVLNLILVGYCCCCCCLSALCFV